MAGLIEQAKADWQRFSSDPDTWGTAINFKAPTSETADVFGIATKHHISMDTEGNPVNTKNTHVSVSEQLLVDAGYPVRDTASEVSMLDHEVKYIDSTGVERTYTIQEHFPDETVGMITFILGDFE